jgi:hypothetical protein
MAQVVNNVNGDNLVEQEAKPKTMTKKCKFWLICCSGVVVVNAVMIPVGLLVIAPKLGQMATDMMSLHIANNSIYNIPANGPGSYDGRFFLNMNLHSPMFIGAIVSDVNVTLILNQPGFENGTDTNNTQPEWWGFSNGPIGYFTQPSAIVTKGDNWMSFDVPVHFNESADHGYRFASWAFYAWIGGVAYIDLVAEPTLTALGFLKLKTKMKKRIACNCIPGSSPACQFPKAQPEVPVTRPRRLDDPVDYMPFLYLFCQPLGTPVYNGTEYNGIDIMSTTDEPEVSV